MRRGLLREAVRVCAFHFFPAGGAGLFREGQARWTLMCIAEQLHRAQYDRDAYSALCCALQRLTPREHQIIHLRFFAHLSQAQIARKLHVSPLCVSRLQRRALLRLPDIL